KLGERPTGSLNKQDWDKAYKAFNKYGRIDDPVETWGNWLTDGVVVCVERMGAGFAQAPVVAYDIMGGLSNMAFGRDYNKFREDRVKSGAWNPVNWLDKSSQYFNSLAYRFDKQRNFDKSVSEYFMEGGFTKAGELFGWQALTQLPQYGVMLMLGALGAPTGVGSTVLGISAGGQKKLELDKLLASGQIDATELENHLNSVASGAVEKITESMGTERTVGKIFNKDAKKMFTQGFATTLLNTMKESGTSEFIEELTAGVGGDINDVIYRGVKDVPVKDLPKYILSQMPEHIVEGLHGFVGGAAMGGGGVAVQQKRVSDYRRQIGVNVWSAYQAHLAGKVDLANSIMDDINRNHKTIKDAFRSKEYNSIKVIIDEVNNQLKDTEKKGNLVTKKVTRAIVQFTKSALNGEWQKAQQAADDLNFILEDKKNLSKLNNKQRERINKIRKYSNEILNKKDQDNLLGEISVGEKIVRTESGIQIKEKLLSTWDKLQMQNYDELHERSRKKYPHRKGKADNKIKKNLKKIGRLANEGDYKKANELLTKFGSYISKIIDSHVISREKALNIIQKASQIVTFMDEGKTTSETERELTPTETDVLETKENPIIDDVINRLYDEDVEQYNEELKIPKAKYEHMKKNKQGNLQTAKKRKVVKQRIEGALKELEGMKSERANEVRTVLQDMLDAEQPDIKGQKQVNVKDIFAKEKPKEEKKVEEKKEEVKSEKKESKKPLVEKKEPAPAEEVEEEEAEPKIEEPAQEEEVELVKVEGKQGKSETVITPKDNEHDTVFEILESDDVIASTLTNFQKNKDYPQKFQPRDRDRAGLKAKVNEMANNLDSLQLGSSRISSNGSPIIGDDSNFIESGNGRVIAIKMAYESGKGVAYKQYLVDHAEEFGLKAEDIAKMNDPILVRRRTDHLSDKARKAFIDESNIDVVAKMSDIEIAASDASNITDGMLELFTVSDTGKIFHAGNRAFVKKFLSDIISANEQNLYVTKEGAYTQALERRISNAVFAKAFPGNEGQQALQFLTESTDNNIKVMTGALLKIAPKIIKIKHMIDEGTRFDLDISNEIARAMMKVSNLKADGISIEEYLQQMDLLDDTDLFVKSIIEAFYEFSRSGKKLYEFLDKYYSAIDQIGDLKQENLFGVEKATKETLLNAAYKEAKGEKEEEQGIDFGEKGKGEQKDGKEAEEDDAFKGLETDIISDELLGELPGEEIVITDEVREKLKEYGFNDAEIKPIAHPELVKMIRLLTGKYPKILTALRGLGAWGVYYHMKHKNKYLAHRIALNPDAYKDQTQYIKTLAHEFGHLIDDMPYSDPGVKGTVLGKLAVLKDGLYHFLKKDTMSEDEYKRIRKDRDKIKTKINNLTNRLRQGKYKEKGNRFKYTEDELQNKIIRLYNELQDIESKFIMDSELRKEMKNLSFYWRPIGAGAADPEHVAYRNKSSELYADFMSVIFNKPELAVIMAPKATEMFFGYLDKKPQVMNIYKDMINFANLDIDEILKQRGIDVTETIKKSGNYVDILFNLEHENRNSPLDNALLSLSDKWTKIFKTERELIKEGVLDPKLSFENMFKISDVRKDQITPEKLAKFNIIKNAWRDDGFDDDDIATYLLLGRNATQRRKYANTLGLQEIDSLNQIIGWLKKKLGQERYDKLQDHIKKLQDWHRKEVVDYLLEQGVITPSLHKKMASENIQEYKLIMPKDIEKQTSKIEEAQLGKVVDMGEISEEDAKEYGFTNWREGIHFIAIQRDNIYAPFIPPYYLITAGVSSQIHKITGYLGEIVNPLQALILKDAAMIKTAYFNGLKRDFANRALGTWIDPNIPASNHKQKIRKAMINSMTGQPIGNKGNRGDFLVYKDGGIKKAVIVDKDIVSAFTPEMGKFQKFIVALFNPFNTVLRATAIVYNPGYVAFNLRRDTKRTFNAIYQIEKNWKYIPFLGKWSIKAKMTLIGLKKLKSAISGARGTPDKIMKQAIEMGLINGNFTDFLLKAEKKFKFKSKDTTNKILRQQGVDIPHKGSNFLTKALLKSKNVFEFVKMANDVVENLSPLIALKYFGNNNYIGKGKPFETQEDFVGYVIEQVGTPAYMVKGNFSAGANATVIFFNMWKASIVALGKQATGKSTQGKSGAFAWWYRTLAGGVAVTAIWMLRSGLIGDRAEKYKDESDAAMKLYEWARYYERSYQNISNYNMASYVAMPVGHIDRNNEVRLILPLAMLFGTKPVDPRDLENIKRTIFIRDAHAEEDRLTMGLTYNALQGDNVLGSIAHLFDFGADQMPGLSPAFVLGGGWFESAKGNNPEDPFYGTKIFPGDEFESGEMKFIDKTEIMLWWSAEKLGLSELTKIMKSYKKSNREVSKLEKNLQRYPVIGRFLKVSNYGSTEIINQASDDLKKADLIDKIITDEFIQDFVDKSYESNNFGAGGSIEQMTAHFEEVVQKGFFIDAINKTKQEMTEDKTIVRDMRKVEAKIKQGYGKLYTAYFKKVAKNEYASAVSKLYSKATKEQKRIVYDSMMPGMAVKRATRFTEGKKKEKFGYKVSDQAGQFSMDKRNFRRMITLLNRGGLMTDLDKGLYMLFNGDLTDKQFEYIIKDAMLSK
ncbi:MAG: hypothetical protein U9O94_08290, partial [Nanoarchaeota archaeon]|nr:hypothetical protein [Nanoarchaeota archaeon]